MNWKTIVCVDLVEAQAQALRLVRHNRTMQKIREYRRYCEQTGNKPIGKIMANCELLYRSGYDL